MATSVRLAVEMEKRLDFLSKSTGRTKAHYLREIVERGLEDLEDYYLSFEILQEIRQGRQRTYTSTEIRKDLGLDS